MSYDREKARFYAFTEQQLGKNAADIHRAPSQIWKDQAPCHATVKNWLADFKSGRRTSFEDLPRCGRPVSASGDDRSQEILILASDDPHITVREISTETGIPTTSAYRILTDVLHAVSQCCFFLGTEDPDSTADGTEKTACGHNQRQACELR